MLHRTTPRWERSQVTFGPVGRVAVTLLLFVPVWFGISATMVFLVPAAIWLFILPMALHHIWAPATGRDDLAWPILRPQSTEPILHAVPRQLRAAEVELAVLAHSD